VKAGLLVVGALLVGATWVGAALGDAQGPVHGSPTGPLLVEPALGLAVEGATRTAEPDRPDLTRPLAFAALLLALVAAVAFGLEPTSADSPRRGFSGARGRERAPPRVLFAAR
jgi:hypothetical protein